MSRNRRIGQQIVVCSQKGILAGNKKEQTTNTCNNINSSQKYYAERKESDKKEYVLYDLIYMKFWVR